MNHNFIFRVLLSGLFVFFSLIINGQCPATAPTGTNGCNIQTGSVELGASGSSGYYSWYDASSGGNFLASGAIYNTPIISAKLHKDYKYRYPIYRSPIATSHRLSRAQISAGALANKGLEIAWTNDPVGLFYVHIQGSGVLQLPNGEKKSLKFDGSNEKPFRSIAKYMQSRGLLRGNPSRNVIKKWLDQHPNSMQSIFNTNPRYIYFTLDEGSVKTASGIPAISGHTVAVDTKYIPFGAVILAEVPIINSWGKTVGNEWRILFSQDRGNAIKGPARLDIYTGVGEQARKMANNLTGYGKMYLLLNKSPFENSLAANDYLFQ